MRSVCMATFNGSKYIEEQLRSILPQLSKQDEVIIVDDASSDETVNKIKSMNDDRISVYLHEENMGHVKSFEHALGLAKGDAIFLSDQDDIWIADRVTLMEGEMRRRSCGLLVSNFYNFEFSLVNKDIQRVRSSRHLFILNNVFLLFAGKQRYFGCTMAIDRKLMDKILPFPKAVEAHDRWIGIVGNLSGTVAHLEVPTVLRRLHEENLTPRSSRKIGFILKSRYNFLLLMGIILIRNIRNG
jgi:glycosyltransferase involved in cell wall biosynthesis